MIITIIIAINRDLIARLSSIAGIISEKTPKLYNAATTTIMINIAQPYVINHSKAPPFSSFTMKLHL